MSRLSLALLLLLMPVLAVSSGCANDCATFCARQGRYIDRCLPEFDEEWSDLSADWANKGDFVGECNELVDDEIERDVGETCASAEEGSSERRECEQLVKQSVFDSCAEDLSKFQQSCSAYWRGEVDFLPGSFDRPPFPADDDDSAGDDDDSAGDDDDSAGDDDDSAGDDDDDSAGDDDDSAGDDDDSAGDDDDSAL